MSVAAVRPGDRLAHQAWPAIRSTASDMTRILVLEIEASEIPPPRVLGLIADRASSRASWHSIETVELNRRRKSAAGWRSDYIHGDRPAS